MTHTVLKTVFMGTPDFSVPALESLIENPLTDVVAVYTPQGAGNN